MVSIKYIIFILLFASTSHASTTIDAQVVRNQAGSGITQISSGFPVPEGLVTPGIITGGFIKVTVGGSEVAANVTGLRGRHPDGTLRSVLIQFLSPSSMAQGDVLTAQVIVDGGARTADDPTYIRPTYTMVTNNNVILPTSVDYLISTKVTFNNLLAVGAGTADEEKLYSTLAENRFDAMTVSSGGTAKYEDPRAMIGMWQRSGAKKYHKMAVDYGVPWLDYTTPLDDYKPCAGDDYINPDGRTTGTNNVCGQSAEQAINRVLSYASLYLLTGYRDFWSWVAYHTQITQSNITSQSEANTRVIKYSSWDVPRFSFLNGYAGIMAAYFIDATFAVPGPTGTQRNLNFLTQFRYILNALEDSAWDVWWIPYDSGTGNAPANVSTITQGTTTATLLGVYGDRNVSRTTAGAAIPASGWIQVKNSTKSGNFTAGAMTSGISVNVTGAGEIDYRNGIIGSRSYSPRSGNPQLPIFQYVIPTHFLMDYYMNIEQDSRIPAMVKKNLDMVLVQMSAIQAGDNCYGQTHATWGSPNYVYPYDLDIPSARPANPWELAEHLRAIAFVLKTVAGAGSETINGASYATWYSRMTNTGNIMPSCLTWTWKNFGQYYGLGADAPWMMAQTTLPSPTYRVPEQWNAIPGDTPDLSRTSGGGGGGGEIGNKWKIISITDDEQ